MKTHTKTENFQNLRNQEFGYFGRFYRRNELRSRSRKKVRASDIELKKKQNLQKLLKFFPFLGMAAVDDFWGSFYCFWHYRNL